MHGRLALNRDQVDECRKLARHVAEHLQKIAERHSTLAIEQAVLRALGAAPSQHHPIIHAIAHKLGPQSMKLGVAGWLGRTMVARKLSPEKAAQYLAKHGLGKRDDLNQVGWGESQRAVRDALNRWVRDLPKLATGKARNGQFRMAVQVAHGDAKRDLSALHRARTQTDLQIVALPAASTDGILTEHRGFFRRKGYPLADAMRRAAEGRGADAADVCWQGNGVPEAAVVAATAPHTRLGVNPLAHHSFTDYNFMVRLSAKTGLRLQHDQRQWGAPEFLDTHLHQVFAMQMVMEQWTMMQGGELDRRVIVVPSLVSGTKIPELVSVLATQQLYRELFSQSEIWHHTSTTHPAWDVGVAALIGFTGAVVSAEQLPTLQQFKEWGQLMKPLAYECQFSDHGHISRRIHTLLERCMKELNRLYRTGFSNVMAQDHGGLFATVKSKSGAEAPFEKDRRYWNPLDEFLGR
jgi:hypothetical protein